MILHPGSAATRCPGLLGLARPAPGCDPSLCTAPLVPLLRQAAAYEAVASQGLNKARSSCSPAQRASSSRGRACDPLHPATLCTLRPSAPCDPAHPATPCTQASANVERLEGARAAAAVHAAAACKRDVALAAEATASRAAEEAARAALDKVRVAAAVAAGRRALANEEEAMAAARRCAPTRELLSYPSPQARACTQTPPHRPSPPLQPDHPRPNPDLDPGARTTSAPLPPPATPLSPRAPNLSSRLTGGRQAMTRRRWRARWPRRVPPSAVRRWRRARRSGRVLWARCKQ